VSRPMGPASALRPVPRRGLRREEAAAYVGISPSKFDRAVAEGVMPQPRTLDACVMWDVRELDERFDALPRRAQAGAPVAPGEVDWDDVAA
jgi:predicted DNA-binding transcriptional regulator AlpA